MNENTTVAAKKIIASLRELANDLDGKLNGILQAQNSHSDPGVGPTKADHKVLVHQICVVVGELRATTYLGLESNWRDELDDWANILSDVARRLASVEATT